MDFFRILAECAITLAGFSAIFVRVGSAAFNNCAGAYDGSVFYDLS